MEMLFITKLFLTILFFVGFCDADPNSCSNIVPGLHKILSSVDITQMELFSLYNYGIDGIRLPIYQQTCNEKNVWTSKSRKVYNVPDQILFVNIFQKGSYQPTADVFRSYKQIKSKMSEDVGISGDLAEFAFSHSISYKRMQKYILTNDKQVVDVNGKETLYEITLNNTQSEDVLHPDFLSAIGQLKGKTFPADKSTYFSFLQKYGTHYFTEGEFGGIGRKYIEVDNDYSNSRTDKELKSHAIDSYKRLINRGVTSIESELSDTDIVVNPEFMVSMKERVYFYGGDGDVLADEWLKEWKNTIRDDPVVVRAKVKPLSNLAPSEDIKQNLEMAMYDYVMRTTLSEIYRILVNVKNKYFKEANFDDLFDKISEFHNTENLNITEVKELIEEVDLQLVAPKWFTDDTKFCLKYNAMRAGNVQCNRRKTTDSETLCATPNSYTTRYHDNTGFGNWGCQMHWGIQSNEPPKWFLDTQVCFEYEKYDSAWGMKEGTDCVPVNKFTDGGYYDKTEYEDDTRGELQWKIVLPENAPLWIHRTQLCFEWEPYHSDDNGEQCDGPSRKLCAKPGEWTAEYFDKTNQNKDGGCYMKWGWQLLSI